MKRAIRYAAENGFDKIAWTTGEQQADRYDMSKKVDTIGYIKNNDGTYNVQVMRGDESLWHDKSATPQVIADNIGKEIAEKIENGEKTTTKDGLQGEMNILSGLDLKVGGKGMKKFYDQMLPRATQKFVKKYGSKVETVSFGDGKESDKEAGLQLGFEITPKMKATALGQGMPLFSYAGKESRTADQSTLFEALRMEKFGSDAEDIRRKTGWHKAKDGLWRYEIDDSAAKFGNVSDLKEENLRGVKWYSGKVGDILDHKELYAAYPELANIDINLHTGSDRSGAYAVYTPGHKELGFPPVIDI
jgi:hypothetical protein